MTRIQYIIFLVLMWGALFASLDPRALAVGAIFAWGLVLFSTKLQGSSLKSSARLRGLGMIWLVGAFLMELILSAIAVAREAWRSQPNISPGIVEVPLSVKSDVEIAVLASLISLTPGTLSLEVSDDRQVLFVHALIVEDDGTSIREHIQRRLERPVIAAFYAKPDST